MISSVLALSLMLTQQLPGGAQRQQFADCLRAFVNEKINTSVEEDEFTPLLAAACREQEAAYRTAYVAAAVRGGDRRSLAESDIELEVEDLRTNFLEAFRSARSR
jgi:hypothetical protein